MFARRFGILVVLLVLPVFISLRPLTAADEAPTSGSVISDGASTAVATSAAAPDTAAIDAATTATDAAPAGAETLPAPAPDAPPAAPTISVSLSLDGTPGYVDGMGFLAQPGQEVELTADIIARAADARSAQTGALATVALAERFEWRAEKGELLNIGARSLTFRCPAESGNYRLTGRLMRSLTIGGAKGEAKTQAAEATIALTFFVQFAFNRDSNGTIAGYPIGIYPNEDAPSAPAAVVSRREQYRPPAWFALVEKDQRGVRISPHFTIGEFCSPYATGDKTYAAVSPRLIRRLEALRSKLETGGRANPRIVILRSYIAPNERAGLERKGMKLSEFSRHQYGDAAAIIIDSDEDGKLDDLNADGVIDQKDAEALGQAVEQTARETGIFGGVGVYGGPTDPLLPDTPFVAFDCRGWAVRF